jgi:hypothetical protein
MSNGSSLVPTISWKNTRTQIPCTPDLPEYENVFYSKNSWNLILKVTTLQSVGVDLSLSMLAIL